MDVYILGLDRTTPIAIPCHTFNQHTPEKQRNGRSSASTSSPSRSSSSCTGKRASRRCGPCPACFCPRHVACFCMWTYISPPCLVTPHRTVESHTYARMQHSQRAHSSISLSLSHTHIIHKNNNNYSACTPFSCSACSTTGRPWLSYTSPCSSCCIARHDSSTYL